MAPISQREARRLMKRVTQLESLITNQRSRWSDAYPGGVQIASAQFEHSGAVPVAICTARKLDHAVVVIADDNGLVRFMALPHPSVEIN